MRSPSIVGLLGAERDQRVGADHGRDAQLRRRELDRDHARAAVALRAGVRGAAQRADDDDVAAGDQFGARIEVADQHDVAHVVQRLAAAQRAAVVERRHAGRRVNRRRRDRDARGREARRSGRPGAAALSRRCARSARAPAKSAASERAAADSSTCRTGRLRGKRGNLGHRRRAEVRELQAREHLGQRIGTGNAVERDAELGQHVAELRDLVRRRVRACRGWRPHGCPDRSPGVR